VDAVEPHWADVLGGLAWLLVVFELDVLFWVGVVRGCEALLS
jgi:hypothetical protein